MDGRDHGGAPATLPSLPPDGRYSGEDGSGQVRVEIDSAARDVAVVLASAWRSAVPPAGLPTAVLQAFTAATTARLIAWATAPAIEQQPPIQPPMPRANQLTVDSLSRAWRDLREFQKRLTTLRNATETASSPGRLAIVTVAGGQLVAIDLDPDWLRTATSQDIEHHIGHALRAALSMIATVPERALEGCPDLAALLAGRPFAAFSSPRESS